MAVIYALKKILAALVTVIMVVITGLSDTQVTDPKKEDILLNFNVLSDTHIESNNFTTYDVFTKILENLKNDGEDDATVFLGDNTMNGQIREHLVFFGALNKAKLDGEVIVAPGNHDFSNGEGDYNKYFKRFMNYSNAFMDYKISTPYFYRVVDGYYFIVVSSEDTTWEYLAMSEAQFEWLDGVLKEAGESGKPIFVFSHYPVENVKGDNDRLSEMLNDYDNLLYFYGHTHFELDEYTAHTYNGVNCINVPKTTETVDYDCGIGAYVEVYEDEVVVRIRDFLDNMDMDGFEYRYEVK